MVRQVHDQLGCALSSVAAAAVGLAVAAAVRDAPRPSPGDYVVALIVTAVWALLKSTRLKGIGMLTGLDATPPLPEPAPAVAPPRRSLVQVRVFVPYLAVGLALVLLFDPWWALLPLIGAADWLTDALVTSLWERRHGRLLWREHTPDEPGRLAHTPLSGPRPPRTATDAPPA
ncbi:hypothetical protein [Streptomyces lincolnensis]|uniref:hypothetical protein n=1 Tax=Streptomyces lincolnensis TaxID=1915 RepID=UPI0037D223F0